ncbi:hypothetical protein STEG23_017730 [Scotinomys teguina]
MKTGPRESTGYTKMRKPSRPCGAAVLEKPVSWGSLANSAAIWAQIQCFRLDNLYIYSIYGLLNQEEKPVLQIQIQEHILTDEDENLKHGCDRRSLWQRSGIYGASETRGLEPDQ